MSRNWYLALIVSCALISTTQDSLAAIIQVDVNSSRSVGQPDGNPSPTASGFSAFDAQDVSVGGSTTSQSALISGHNVTFTTLGGASFQTRDRQGVNGANYPATTTGNFYRDSIQADGGTSGSAGMRVQVDTLTAGATYELTLWTHEVNTSDPPDGITIKDVNNANATIGSGTFPGSPQVPSDLTVSRFNVLAKADGSGVLNVDLIHTGNGPGGSFIFGALPLNGFILSSSTLSVDINSTRGSQSLNPSPSAPGFSPFDALDTSVGGSNSSQSAFIDGHNVTLTAVGGAVFQTRDREGVNGADFPDPPSVIGDLYRDSIQADGGTNGAAGMELNIDGLAANSQYSLTLWTHEVFNNGTTTDTVTITDANIGNAILASGPFPGSPQVPTDLLTSRFDVFAMTDANGILKVDLLHSWTGASPEVGALTLNGFQLNLVPVPVPEPSSFAMLACAGILLFGGSRRRPTARR